MINFKKSKLNELNYLVRQKTEEEKFLTNVLKEVSDRVAGLEKLDQDHEKSLRANSAKETGNFGEMNADDKKDMESAARIELVGHYAQMLQKMLERYKSDLLTLKERSETQNDKIRMLVLEENERRYRLTTAWSKRGVYKNMLRSLRKNGAIQNTTKMDEMFQDHLDTELSVFEDKIKLEEIQHFEKLLEKEQMVKEEEERKKKEEERIKIQEKANQQDYRKKHMQKIDLGKVKESFEILHLSFQNPNKETLTDDIKKLEYSKLLK